MRLLSSLPASLLEYTRLLPVSRCVRFHSTAAGPSAQEVRLRFGPSPTGYLHLGGFRTALFNYLVAKSLGGKFLLRIEDTDRTRLVEGAQEALISTLKWAGIQHDEGPGIEGPYGPYVQSERTHIYDRHIDKLLKQDRAYRCFCSVERLEATREQFRAAGSSQSYDNHCRYWPESEIKALTATQPFVVRLKNLDQPTHFDDLVYGNLGPAQPKHKLHPVRAPFAEDFILIKQDKMPTYHFANVVDDHEMKISHVLRGEEWITSTPRHLALYKAFGWSPPKFAHLPILVGPTGKKLSKRDGDVHIEAFRERGFEPSALTNAVAMLGASWRDAVSAKGEPLSDYMTMEDMIRNFSIERISKHRSIMTDGKLAFLNKQHLSILFDAPQTRKNVLQRTVNLLKPAFPASTILSDEAAMARFLNVMKTYISKLNDLLTLKQVPPLLLEPEFTQESMAMLSGLNQDVYRRILHDVRAALAGLPQDRTLTEEEITQILDEVHKEYEMSKGKFMTVLRHALTAQKQGVSVREMIQIFGPERTRAKLHRASRTVTWRE